MKRAVERAAFVITAVCGLAVFVLFLLALPEMLMEITQ